MTDAEIVGSVVRGPGGPARVVTCSQLLKIALVELLDEHDQPTGRHATCDPTRFQLVQEN